MRVLGGDVSTTALGSLLEVIAEVCKEEWHSILVKEWALRSQCIWLKSVALSLLCYVTSAKLFNMCDMGMAMIYALPPKIGVRTK